MKSFWIEKTQSDLVLHNKYGIYSKNELELQLREGHFTTKELGSIYQLNTFQIIHVLRLLNIIDRNPINDIRIISPIITPEIHQVLIGTLLGDACMTNSKAYRLSHSINQLDYFYHISNCLGPFVSSVGYKETKQGNFLFLWTNRHDIFIPYFNRFYSKGKSKKYLMLKSIQDLDPRGLAYWYMDDGKYNEYGAYFCVGNISNTEGAMIVNFLKEKFNLCSTFQAQNIKKRHFNIYIKAESRAKFFNLIEPFIIPSMHYKLTGESPSQQAYSKNLILERHLSLCEKARKNIKYSGDCNIQKELKEKTVNFDFKREFMEKIKTNIRDKKQISYTKFRTIPSKKDLIKMFLEGDTDKDIAECFKVGRNRIGIMRRSLGIARKRYR